MTSKNRIRSVDQDLGTVLAGGGEMGARMRAFDWSRTVLGPVSTWPQSLRSALSICLGSRFPIAIYWGPKLGLVYNDAWSPIPGTKHPWALGREAKEVWPEIWKSIGPLFEQVMGEGEATYSEDSLLPMHRHGYTEECYFNFTFSPIRGEHGRVDGVFNAVIETTFRVISERRGRALRELAAGLVETRSIEQVLATAIHSLGAQRLDVPFCAAYLVESGARQLRLAAAAGIPMGGDLAPSLVPFEELGRCVWPLARAMETGCVQDVQGLGPERGLPGGEWPEPAHAAMVAPILSATGAEPQGLLLVGASPRRALDDDYRHFAESAARHVSTALTSATAFEEARRKAAALAEIDRAKTVFFSNVSHEFRTPLALMLGPTEDLLAGEHGALAPAQREQLEVVHRNELRLHKLVNALLDFSRIEAGRVQAKPVPVDLPELTRDLASSFRSSVERVGVALQVDCPPLPGAVLVDREMWEKIVFNLLSNAVKFTFEGTIAVSLRHENGNVVLRVTDTGVGIPAEEVPRMFERFHRVASTRARTHEGSGIGLALVHDLAKLHGGSVAVESVLGRGSTFSVSLPMGSSPLPAAPPAPGGHSSLASAFVNEADRWSTGDASPSGSARVSASDAAERILLADDNADMRDYVRRILERRYRVEAVEDGHQALESALASPPALVLTDVMMPKLDGFELMRKLRQEERTRRVPIVMLSARAGEDAVVESLEAGADDYLMKPFSARELVARIDAQMALRRVQREADLQREHLEALFMQAPTPICILRGPEHVVELVNSRCCDVWGRRHEDTIGRPLLDVLPEVRNTIFEDLLATVFRTGAPFVGKETPAEFRRADGTAEVVYFNFVYAPYRNTAGAILGVLVLAFDVTEEILARRNMDRLRKTAEEASDALREADRRKDEFLAMLAHELRNPLGPIVNATALLKLRGAAGLERSTAVIERQVSHLSRLLDDLLDVSRITRGKIVLRRERLDLVRLLTDTVEDRAEAARDAGLALSLKLPDLSIPIRADRTRMAQAISNLIGNAIKFTDRGGRIQVSLERSGSTASVIVEDDGAGIDEALLPRVFDTFVQADHSLDRSRGGLGLGLSVVKALVELHEGSVEAHSAGPGKGARFVIRLPIADDGDRREADPVRGGAPKLRPLRILIVEDNEDAADTLRDLLVLRNHEVRIARTGLDAAPAAREFRPEVVLCDLGLPGRDGYAVAEEIRKEPALTGTRLVATTGYGTPDDRLKTEVAGFHGHLTKPVDPALLERMLEEML